MQAVVRSEATVRLISLAEAAQYPDEAGRKAANLGVALAAGFPVPDGVVLTATVTAEAEMSLPASVEEQLRVALLRWHGPVAVRSSALAEDLADASFAGQYETVLGVEGYDAVLAAIQHCWASAAAERVQAYAKGRSTDEQLGIGVLIQRMVRAEAAGVAFTANPVTGDRSETLVSAVRGIGERLVSGAVTPDEWSVRDGHATCRLRTDGAISAKQANEVATLARRVEQLFGAPQDIEWAIDQGDLLLLQARPITTLPAAAGSDTAPVPPLPVPVEIPPGFWEREAVHSPKPMSPALRSLLVERRNAAFRATFEQFGVLAETLETREIGGWEYARLVPPGGKDGPTPPAWALRLYVRLHPAMRRRLTAARTALRTDLPTRMIRTWLDEQQPDLAARIQVLGDVELAGLADEELLAHWTRVDNLISDAIPIHFGLHAPIALARKELLDVCRELLGWGEQRALELLAGYSQMSTRPAMALAELARRARQQPTLLAILERPETTSTEDLAAADPEFAAVFARYQREFGMRGLRYEVAEPTLAETPAITLATLRDQIHRGYDPLAHEESLASLRANRLEEARQALASRASDARARFERALVRAELAHPAHEQNEFYTVSAPIALLRYALLELGRRLKGRGSIDRAEDVFFLEIPETLAAFRASSDFRPLVARRRGELAWVLAHPGPASYGPPPGPPPNPGILPKEARTIMEAIRWAVDRTFPPAPIGPANSPNSTRVHGIPASAGRYTGPVRVVMSENEFGKIQAGDVLVCPVTSPVWSVLFSRIGALVTDSGGMLSHPAIIAREYGIPAIVATGNATTLLRDGQYVTVDGQAGVVEIQ